MNRPPAAAAPWCIRTHNGPWPLHDAAGSRAVEAAAMALLPAHALMQRAGQAVARLTLAMAPHARCIRLLAGPGNNGGDALVAARILHGAGKSVQLSLLADPARLPADAQHALAQAQAAGVAIDTAVEFGADTECAVDGLLGLGAGRPVTGALAVAIQSLANSGAPVLAIDLPSGLNPDTGHVLGGLAVRAHATLALLTLKPGLFTASGRDHAG
ncbi:MAG: NAD(P)H-hydrate epimerase, partial [Rubrivivax sp.]|nr:NAD(P)H-hydrate epimerase [Rubrivivax sp.]